MLSRLSGDLAHELGDSLLSVAVHGSWVAGDFIDGRSGLGVLVVLADDPDRTTLGIISHVHQRLVRDFPRWRDHIEIDFVSPAAVHDVLHGTEGRVMARICPGELLHLGLATPQFLLNWRSAVEHNQVLVGQSPSELLPEITDALLREAVLAQVRNWPFWIDDVPGASGEAYAVLTVCRAATLLRTGRWISKRAAAEEFEAYSQRWSELVRWAREWWYAGGLTLEPSRSEEVRRFVQETCHQLDFECQPVPVAG